MATNLRVARAAYEAALNERPKHIVRLKQRALVVAERVPEGLPLRNR